MACLLCHPTAFINTAAIYPSGPESHATSLKNSVVVSLRAIMQLFRFVVVILGEEIPMPLPIRHKPLRPIRHLLSSGAQIRAFGLSKEELLFYKIRGLIIDLLARVKMLNGSIY